MIPEETKRNASDHFKTQFEVDGLAVGDLIRKQVSQTQENGHGYNLSNLCQNREHGRQSPAFWGLDYIERQLRPYTLR
jgi:hypothetical protein